MLHGNALVDFEPAASQAGRRSGTHTKGSLTETTNTCPAVLRLGWFMYDGTCLLEHVPVKAPGTPTMYPLDALNSSARLTVLPGEFSKSSRLGTSSPTLTETRVVAWKLRAAPKGRWVRVRAARRRDARRAIAAMELKLCFQGRACCDARGDGKTAVQAERASAKLSARRMPIIEWITRWVYKYQHKAIGSREGVRRGLWLCLILYAIVT